MAVERATFTGDRPNITADGCRAPVGGAGIAVAREGLTDGGKGVAVAGTSLPFGGVTTAAGFFQE